MYPPSEGKKYDFAGTVLFGKRGEAAGIKRNEAGEYEVTFCRSDFINSTGLLRVDYFSHTSDYCRLIQRCFPELINDKKMLTEIVERLARSLAPCNFKFVREPDQGLYITSLHDIIFIDPNDPGAGGYIFCCGNAGSSKSYLQGDYKLQMIDQRHVVKTESFSYGYYTTSFPAQPREINPAVITFVGVKQAILDFELLFEEHFNLPLRNIVRTTNERLSRDKQYLISLFFEQFLFRIARWRKEGGACPKGFEDINIYPWRENIEWKNIVSLENDEDNSRAIVYLAKKALQRVFPDWVLTTEEENFLQHHKQQKQG